MSIGNIIKNTTISYKLKCNDILRKGKMISGPKGLMRCSLWRDILVKADEIHVNT